MNQLSEPNVFNWGTTCTIVQNVSPCFSLRQRETTTLQAPVSALPMHMMSGTICAHSAAKSFPVRPKPVAILDGERVIRHQLGTGRYL